MGAKEKMTEFSDNPKSDKAKGGCGCCTVVVAIVWMILYGTFGYMNPD